MAVAESRTRLMTAEELTSPGVPEKFVELINGELVPMAPAGRSHNRTALNIAFAFRVFCSGRPGLDYCGDNDGFLIRRAPDTVLSPDACLFRARPDTGATWYEFAPEVVVEVLSPSNSRAEMAFKRERFFEAGSEQFWLVDPEAQTLDIFHRDGRIVPHDARATVIGEGIAAGLALPLPEVFQAAS